jgi:nitrogen-specific signal transduction histidine kinase
MLAFYRCRSRRHVLDLPRRNAGSAPDAARERADFHRLLDALPAAAYMCDSQGLITYFDQRAVEAWGREPRLSDPQARYCRSFRMCSPSGEPVPHDPCWMALCLKEARQYFGEEIVVVRPTGDHLLAQAFATPFYDEQGNLIGAVNFVLDITERKRAEDALKEADRRKDQFLAILAHELRGPLAPMRSELEILRRKCPPDPDLSFATDIIETDASDDATRRGPAGRRSHHTEQDHAA